MDAEAVQSLVDQLTAQWGRAGVRREPIRVWEMSVVERLHAPGGETAVFKYARAPFDAEARVLGHAARHGVPVPALFAEAYRPGLLGMLLEDLGPVAREATLGEGARAAAVTHAVPGLPRLAVLDAAGLAELPKAALASLDELTGAGRWTDAEDIRDGLRALLDSAAARAAGAQTPPFGLCHSEFHPTSLHVGGQGDWRLLDWARGFTGPGLLDLVSWQGTTRPPDYGALDRLLDAYVAAGGPAQVRDERGGLPAARWAVLWHRTWVIEWYLAQAATWIGDLADDPAYQRVVRRHLGEALECVTTPTG